MLLTGLDADLCSRGFNRTHDEEDAIKYSGLIPSKYLLVNRDVETMVEDSSFGFIPIGSENVLERERGIKN